MFKQYGIELSRKTTAQWMMRSADILQSLSDKLRRLLLEQPVIYADETILKVVGDNMSKSYMWLYASGADSPEGKLLVPISLTSCCMTITPAAQDKWALITSTVIAAICT
tara:strand:+ start:3800 stop:4129 length:330 start_codon:yes stop_codon:yes gene_type:complete